jgi:hypothetical protein
VWAYRGECAKRTVDYLERTYARLTATDATDSTEEA